MTALILVGVVGYLSYKLTKFALKAANPAGTAVESGVSVWQWLTKTKAS